MCNRKYLPFALLLVLLLMLSGCGNAGEKAVMTVGGNAVSYDEYRYFYMNFRKDYEAMGEVGDLAGMKSAIEEALRLKYAKVELAEEAGVTLSDSELAELNNTRASYVEYYGGEEGFAEALNDNSLTEALFMKQLEFQALEQKLREYAYEEFSGMIQSDDATVEAYIQSDFCHATQILIRSDAGDDLVVNYQLAQELHDRAVCGEDFDALIREYNEDPGMSGDTVGYYFTHGQLLKKFEDAAYALEIGGISDVIMTENGYHIIKRLPLDDDYINEHFEELRILYKVRMFNVMADEKAQELEVRYLKRFDALTDESLRTSASEK